LCTLAFVVNHDHPRYAGKLPMDTIIEILATAHGRFGSCADYLFKTVRLSAPTRHPRRAAHRIARPRESAIGGARTQIDIRQTG
jgi:cation transport protein ChaC